MTTVEQDLRSAVELAVRAPSGHNTQPWTFVVDGPRLRLLADRTRRLPVVDPDDRALEISCGAALAYLLLALEELGHLPSVEVQDDADDDLIATVTLSGARQPAGRRSQEVAAVLDRHTNRTSYATTAVPQPVLEQMQARARDVGAWLEPVDGAHRTAVADLVAEGDRRQLADAAFRRELAAWVRPNSSARLDGVRGYGFGIGDLLSHVGPFVVRTFDTGRRQAAKDRAAVLAAPALLVLGTDGDARQDHVAAGRAIAGALLPATLAGVSVAFLNQPVEVADLRPRLQDQLGRDGHPQLLLRAGYGRPPRPQPRRPVEEVLTRT